ncbi:hypothetical protein Klosneuvirus_4_134 [Klosneuvirus KNV1]|uniref:Uncharacterized protein n=1 Tax=Klosneuvirus KNV1 TaxID=1977640 RepID=A0A1V0SKP5_9VIRU|nr:hypothetical protein Klosneuvirus_4_134 [Klosneuvirus KNV1]
MPRAKSRKSKGSRKSRKSQGSKKGHPNKWITALKRFNKGKSTYTVPKKGSADYNAVKKIMASL